MGNLINRIQAIENKTINYENVTPVLFLIAAHENLEEAKEAYKKRNGFDLPKSALIIVLEMKDCKKENTLRMNNINEKISF